MHADVSDYRFTNDWFSANAKPIWDNIIFHIAPRKLLEVGSYEGASAVYLIDNLCPRQAIELHCVDSWEGGIEHNVGGSFEANMGSVEERFKYNIGVSTELAVHKPNIQIHKSLSTDALSTLVADNKKNYFDFIYIDGSHQAPDVLCDAVLGFALLNIGGVMAFDDYLWSEALPYGKDLLRCPKPAIDAFTNLFARKLELISTPMHQLFIRKITA